MQLFIDWSYQKLTQYLPNYKLESFPPGLIHRRKRLLRSQNIQFGKEKIAHMLKACFI